MDERRIVTTDGNERVINSTVIGKFASDLRGELLCPSDEGYDTARRMQWFLERGCECRTEPRRRVLRCPEHRHRTHKPRADTGPSNREGRRQRRLLHIYLGSTRARKLALIDIEQAWSPDPHPARIIEQIMASPSFFISSPAVRDPTRAP
jgi:hypothetical protein